jgi:hypothetical protein
MFAIISNTNLWYAFIGLILSVSVILLAHYTNKRRGNRDIHEKGEKRDRQKYTDKKRQEDNWKQNNNKKPRKRKRK